MTGFLDPKPTTRRPLKDPNIDDLLTPTTSRPRHDPDTSDLLVADENDYSGSCGWASGPWGGAQSPADKLLGCGIVIAALCWYFNTHAGKSDAQVQHASHQMVSTQQYHGPR